MPVEEVVVEFLHQQQELEVLAAVAMEVLLLLRLSLLRVTQAAVVVGVVLVVHQLTAQAAQAVQVSLS